MSGRSLLLSAILLVAAAASAPAGPGGAGDVPTPVNPGIPQERRVLEDVTGSPITPGREAPAGIQVDGRVVTGSGAPLAGVLVKVFSNGVVTATERTDSDGSFAVRANPAVGGNNTTVLWFESPDPERYLDSQAVLHEGTVARELGLFPPCVQKTEIAGSNAQIEVTMMTLDERKAALEQSRCLERGSR